MGVLACDRKNCENIMCDRYSPEHGYICGECFEELIDSEMFITIFMQTEREPKSGLLKVDRRKYIEEAFPLRSI